MMEQSVGSHKMTAAEDLQMSDRHFAAIAEIAQSQFGLSLQQSKKGLVRSRLVRRLREIHAVDFDAYLAVLKADVSHNGEMTHLLSALTTNVTHFFRERHHFDLLRTQALPGLIAHAKAGGRVRLWSAGCSSGQEPYCLAMTVLEACPDAARLDIKILATDVDPAILRQAVAGVYQTDSIEPQDRAIVDRYFEEQEDGRLSASPALRKLISFGRINLVAKWPVSGPFDAIFCRNVAIYFEKATQATLWQGFYDVLAPGGFLIIGHSERVNGPAADALQSAGITAYLKPTDAAKTVRPTAPNGDTA